LKSEKQIFRKTRRSYYPGHISSSWAPWSWTARDRGGIVSRAVTGSVTRGHLASLGVSTSSNLCGFWLTESVRFSHGMSYIHVYSAERFLRLRNKWFEIICWRNHFIMVYMCFEFDDVSKYDWFVRVCPTMEWRKMIGLYVVEGTLHFWRTFWFFLGDTWLWNSVSYCHL